MEQLKMLKEQIVSAIQGQMGNLQNVDTSELGDAIDMVKDLAEAIYYCTITEAMDEKGKESEKEGGQQHIMYYPPIAYYTEKIREPYYPERDMDRGDNRMYYPEMNPRYYGGGSSGGGNSGGGSSSGGGGTRGYSSSTDSSETGRSGGQRRTYMEARKYHTDKSMHMKELEKYIQDLGSDLTEMISGASPEEKQLLQRKLTMLANKVTDA